jgi:hypothetical protein
VLLFTIILAGCATEQTSPQDVLVSEVLGGWKRSNITTPASPAPDVIEKLGVDSSAEAVYGGPGRVTVRVYKMRSETGAFEAMQKWRPPDGVGIQKGRYFLTASGGTSSANLALVSELQKLPVR